ncbi:PalH/RIM21-domain-containing protein [Triangularia verruculosa]|uniref:PalH/RIM21-domain-containing protein n=1 Tax=Triangularia verruculosa TaxID=2587418 RepID=A0AAN7AQG3_9PEZI|nr:PalH/RIM21-domain-containing protein [Triangularia verruculosa]
MEARQLFAPAPTDAPFISKNRNCAGLNLPVGGILSMPNGDVVTLTASAAFKPVCTPVTPPAIIANAGGGSVELDPNVGAMPDDGGWTYSDFRDPFYASTFPQCYALAATTVVAYMLVIMLFVTPRSFLDGGVVVLGRRGFTHSGSGPTIGGRPWFQKVAALSVVISLTIASAATFQAAERQYEYQIQNAKALQEEVLGGNELKAIRIVSNTFLWLAQAQTLIRLFPRQREKVIIKWTAFALITLDVIFQSLNSFRYTDGSGTNRPGSFSDAIPALSYLFTLALGVLYAAWVVYYSLMKKRYAFYHPQMKNMCLMAALSLMSVLIPVVFFILDIAKPDFTGWGEYVRWVGAAAASVVVWEWVERIEALEREEKRDGILGREVFDGDEMLDVMTSDGHARRRRKGSGSDGGDKEMHVEKRTKEGAPEGERGNIWPSVIAMKAKYKSRLRPKNGQDPADKTTTQPNSRPSNHNRIQSLQPPLWPARPAPTATPISRTDTASAASTVYAVRYHQNTDAASQATPPPLHNASALSRTASTSSSRSSDDRSTHRTEPPPQRPREGAQGPEGVSSSRWQNLTPTFSFKRSRRSDEENAASAEEKKPPREGDRKWDIRGRFEDFTANQAERLREKFRPAPDTDSLPVTVIPAPPRRGAALAQLLEDEELQYQRATTPVRTVSDLRSPTNDSSPTTLVGRPVSILTGSRPQITPTGTQISFADTPTPTVSTTRPTEVSTAQPTGGHEVGASSQGSGSTPGPTSSADFAGRALP